MIPNFTCLILFGRLSTTCSFIPSLVAVDSIVGDIRLRRVYAVEARMKKIGNWPNKIFAPGSEHVQLAADKRGGRKPVPAPGKSVLS